MEECGRKVLVFSDKCINSPINVVNIYSYFFLLVNSVVGTASHINKLFGKFQSLKITSKLELKSRYVIVKFPRTMKLWNAGLANPLVATFRAEKRSGQASAHPLSQAQGGLFCVLTVFVCLEF